LVFILRVVFSYAQDQPVVVELSPQLMVHSAECPMENRRVDVSVLIQKNLVAHVMMRLSTKRSGTTLIVALNDSKKCSGYDTHLVLVSPHDNVEILSGENEVKTLSCANVVTHRCGIGIWGGQRTARLQVYGRSFGNQAILV
jgi:hypothetical protein